MIRPVEAKTLYEMAKEADIRGSYHELPHIMNSLTNALYISIKTPDKYGWGTFGQVMTKLKPEIKKIKIEMALKLFKSYFHVVFFEDRIEIIGRDLMDGHKYSIKTETGLEDVVIIGHDSAVLDSYTYCLKNSQPEETETKIKRYSPSRGGYQGIEFFGMEENEQGEWVKYADNVDEKRQTVDPESCARKCT